MISSSPLDGILLGSTCRRKEFTFFEFGTSRFSKRSFETQAATDIQKPKARRIAYVAATTRIRRSVHLALKTDKICVNIRRCSELAPAFSYAARRWLPR